MKMELLVVQNFPVELWKHKTFYC